MKLKTLSRYSIVSAFAFAAVSFLACGGEVINSGNLGCPEDVVCDTAFVNTKAYSFVYFSGKDKLDTVTATTDKMSCNLWKGYFECTLKKTYSTCRIVYSKAESSVKSDDEPVTHQKVEIKRGDTTYINYGKNRLMDYIPPYVEIPKFDSKKLKAAFDTVIVEPTSYASEKLKGESRKFVDAYYIEYSGLPDWAYVSKNSGQLLVLDGEDGTRKADTTFISDGIYLIEISSCTKTVYIDYPKKLIAYQSYVNVYADSTELPRKDTTIKWMAHYTDMYGTEDSLQVKTLFKIKRKK